jgi:hypothetical protein
MDGAGDLMGGSLRRAWPPLVELVHQLSRHCRSIGERGCHVILAQPSP